MSEKEQLVSALGRAMQKRNDSEDPRWDALEAGELDAAATRELTARAAMDAAREEALLDQALGAPGAEEAGRRVEKRQAKPLWGRPRARLGFALAAALALVGAAGLAIRLSATSPIELPDYSLVALADPKTLGSSAPAEEGVLEVSPGREIRIELTPKGSDTRPVIARFFLVSGSDVRQAQVNPKVDTRVTLVGAREALFPGAPAGVYELVGVVRAEATLASEEDLIAMAREPARSIPGLRALRRRVKLLADPDPPAVAEARALRSEGKPKEAMERLEAAPDGLPKARLRARLALDLNRIDEAARLFEEAIRAGKEARDVGGTGKDILSLAYVRLDVQREVELAAKVVEENDDILSAWPLGAADVLYTRGRIARARGQVLDALSYLRRAVKQAEEVGPIATRDPAKEILADLLATLGRHEEARVIARSIALPNDRGCQAAQARNNVAWFELRAAWAGAASDGRGAKALLDEALTISRSGCPRGAGKVLTNLAIAEFLRGAEGFGEARRLSEEARKAQDPVDPEDSVWWAVIDAEAELGAGHSEAAISGFERARAIGEAGHFAEGALIGVVGRARALDRGGRVEDARRAFEEADRALDAWARRVPLGEGRGLFLAENARATRLWAEFLERRGSPADVLRAIRRGANRYFLLLHSAAAGDALSEPPPLPEGAALLAATALPGSGREADSGALAAAGIGGHAVMARLDSLNRSKWPDLAAAEPFASVLKDAGRLLVPAGDALRNIDVHAALFQRKPLIARMPVAYSMGLEPRPLPPRPDQPKALVVADTSIKEIREQLDPLKAELSGRGLDVKVLEPAGATPGALREALEDPSTYAFYYVGHAAFEGKIPDGLDAKLTLPEGVDLFSVRDVLALKRVPPYVVLLACESAGTSTGGDSLGLAQAFLLKGAQAAVASRTILQVKVVEALGPRLVSAFGASVDLPAALARAQAALSEDKTLKESDWAALRALVR